MSETTQYIDTTVPGPYASRSDWDAIVRDNNPRQNGDNDRILSGLDAIDPSTGMLRSEAGMSEDEYQRANSGGVPPNPALYISGGMRNPARHMAGNEQQADWAYYSHIARTLRAMDGGTVALLREAGDDGFSKAAAANERGAVNGPYHGFTVVGDTTEQAKIARKIIEFSMEHRKTDSQINPIAPMANVTDLPPREAVLQLANDIRPTFERGREVAVILPPFMKATAVASWIQQNPGIAQSPLIVPETQQGRDYLRGQGLNIVDDKETLIPDAQRKTREWFQQRNEAINAAVLKADRIAVAYRAPQQAGRGVDELMEAGSKALIMGKLIHFGHANPEGNAITPVAGAEAHRFITQGKEDERRIRNIDGIQRNDVEITSQTGQAALALITSAGGKQSLIPVSQQETMQAYDALAKHQDVVPNFTTAYQMATDVNGAAFLKNIGVPQKVIHRLNEGSLIRDMLPLAQNQTASNDRTHTRQTLGTEIGDPQSFLVYTQGNPDAIRGQRGIFLYGDQFNAEANAKIIESPLFKGKDVAPVYVEGVSAPTRAADVPEGGILVARSGAAFTTQVPKLNWKQTAPNEMVATHEQDTYKLVSQRRNNNSDNSITLMHGEGKNPSEFTTISMRGELPNIDTRSTQNRTDSEKRWNTAKWEEATLSLKMAAIKDAMTREEARKPELQAIREVRAAFAERGGTVVYPAPASFRTAQWNHDTLNYQVVLSDGQPQGNISNAIGLSSKTVIMQDSGKNSMLGQVASMNAKYEKDPLTVVWPSNNASKAHNAQYIGNAVIASLPYQEAGKRLGLNFNDAHVMTTQWKTQRPGKLDLDTGTITLPAQKNDKNIDISR